MPGKTGYWALSDPEFNLGKICDGYIYLGPLSEYEGVSVAEGFFTEENRLEVIMQGGKPELRDSTRTVESIIESLSRDANIKRRLRSFK